MVTTSTNGTSATTARQRSGRWLKTAPCSRPPALSPRVAIRSGVDQPGGGEPVGDRDVVVEGVLLVLQPAVEPPAAAALAAAADVGVHEDDAAVEQRWAAAASHSRLAGVLVGAVAVEQRGRGAVERGVAVPHERGRHRGAVRARGSVRTSVDVRRGVVARGLVRGARRSPRRRPGRPPTCTTGSVWDSSATVTAVARRTRCCAPAGASPPAKRLATSMPGAGQVVDRQHPQQCGRRRGAASAPRARRTRRPAPAARPGPRAAPRARPCGPGRRGAGTGQRRQPELDRAVVGDEQQHVRPSGDARARRGTPRPAPPPADASAGARSAPVGVDDPHLAGVAALAEQTRPGRRCGIARTSSSNRSSGSSSTQHVVGDRRAEPVPPDLVRPVGLVVDGVEEVPTSRRVQAPP